MKKSQIDMLNGPLFRRIVLFAVPIMISSILQLLFNAVDIMVVGRFAGDQALAAVSSTTALINLLVNLFIGLSIGSNVLVAQYLGARKTGDAGRAAHTAVLASLVGGLILAVVGYFYAGVMLRLMGSPEDVIDLSTLYVRVYFAGMPFNLLYNFGSSIMKAGGDVKHPTNYLIVAGVLNLLLNLLFVIVFHLSVLGVALGTILSQAVSAGLTLHRLMAVEGPTQIHIKKLRIDWPMLGRIFRIGLPAGIQSSVISMSNIIIQSSINSFGTLAVAGNGAASSIESFTYTSINAVYQATLNFTSVNKGARKYDRVLRTLGICLLLGVGVGFVLGQTIYRFGSSLLWIYTDSQEAIAYGILRMSFCSVFYFISGISEVLVGFMRGMGFSFAPMLVTIVGMCGFRVLWIFTYFRANPALESVYVSYPISWVITSLAHLACAAFVLYQMRVEIKGERLKPVEQQ